MKKVVLVAAVFGVSLAATVVAGVSTTRAVSPRPSCPYVFLVPHQDDELLTMGAGIREHVRVHGGGAVCVVFMTTGTNSAVQDQMKNPSFNPDGRAYDLGDAAFTRARDRESWNALVWMGVAKDHIFLNGYATPDTGVARIFDRNDGSNQDQISRWMRDTISFFGPRHYKTMTDKSADAGDHHVMGVALREIAEAGSSDILSSRYYSEPYRRSSVALSKVGYSENDKMLLQKANNSFRVWGPANGYYRIGYRSVTAPMDAHYADPVSLVHG